MKNINKLLSIQGLLFCLMVSGPSILGYALPLEKGFVRDEEILDLILPFLWLASVLILLKTLKPQMTGLFSLLIVLSLYLIVWGTGVHLVGNYINDFVLRDVQNNVVKDSAYFYDETFSHKVYLLGYLTLISTLLFSLRKIDLGKGLNASGTVISLINGFVFFLFAVEGQTALLTILGSIAIIVVFTVYLQTKSINLKGMNILQRYYILMLISTLSLLAVWGIYYGKFPQFSELGII